MLHGIWPLRNCPSQASSNHHPKAQQLYVYRLHTSNILFNLLFLFVLYDVGTDYSHKMRAKHSSVRSQFVHYAKGHIISLYGLNVQDPTALSRTVDYLLESDRYMCDPKGRDVC